MSAQVLSSRLAYSWHWPNDVTAPGSATHAAAVPPVPELVQIYQQMAGYAQGGDFEGVLTYGIGIARPVLHSNPQPAVRAYEVETVTPSGQHLYTVAIDIDATNLA